MQGEDQQIKNLEERRRVERVYTDERRRRSGYKDSELINSRIRRIEGAVGGEGGIGEGEEEGRCDAKVYGVFRYVDEKEGKHATKKVSRKGQTGEPT